MLTPTPLNGSPLWWGALGLLGLAVGVVGGMFGIGGGFLLIPLLNVLFGVPLDIAVGTGLCQMIGTAVAAFRRHRRLRQGEVKVDWIMLAGALLGVNAGARVMETLSARGDLIVWGHPIPAVKFWLFILYAVLLTGVAAWMLYDASARSAAAPPQPGPLTRLRLPPYTLLPNSGQRVSVLMLAYLGLVLGFLAGLVGLGGGIILMPVLMYGIGMRMRQAAGTGIVLLLFTAGFGTLTHAGLGHVHLGLAMTLLAGSTLGAPLGATLTSRLDVHRLRGIFAFLILLAAAAVLWDLFRVLRGG